MIDAEVITECNLEREVERIMASDLMSDVLSYGISGTLLVTSLTNVQTVRAAEVIELSGIVYARGKRPSDEAIRVAQSKNVPLLRSDKTVFSICGTLHNSGFKDIQDE